MEAQNTVHDSRKRSQSHECQIKLSEEPNVLSSLHDNCFKLKFISEERLNYITQRVLYDHKKKLEDQAWKNFVAKKHALETANDQIDNNQNIESTHQTTHFSYSPSSCQQSDLNHNDNSSENVLDKKCLSYPKQNDVLGLHVGVSRLHNPHHEEFHGSEDSLSDYNVQSIDARISQMDESDAAPDGQSDTTSGHGQNNNDACDYKESSLTYSAANLFDTKDNVNSSSILSEITQQNARSDMVSLTHSDHLVNGRDSSHTGDLYGTIDNKFKVRITRPNLSQLSSVWRKVVLNLDGISSFFEKTPEPDDDEELLQWQRRGTEFASLFARNYVYSLRRKIQELHDLVKSALKAGTSTQRFTRHANNKIQLSLLAAHHAANNAFGTYLKYMPSTLFGDVSDKLMELLHLSIDLCTACNQFTIEPIELKDGLDKVEQKCKTLLLHVKNQKEQVQEYINEQCSATQLSSDGKTITKHKRNRTASVKPTVSRLAMYLTRKPPNGISKGIKNKIKHLAKTKFGSPPLRQHEAMLDTNIANKNPESVNSLDTETLENSVTTKNALKNQENVQDWIGKYDDTDNVQTLVGVFGRPSENLSTDTRGHYISHLVENKQVFNKKKARRQSPRLIFTDQENAEKTGGSFSGSKNTESITKKDQKMGNLTHNNSAAVTEMENPSYKRIFKEGAPNAQLILLPPYQTPDCSPVDTVSTSQGAWQERLQQKRNQRMGPSACHSHEYQLGQRRVLHSKSGRYTQKKEQELKISKTSSVGCLKETCNDTSSIAPKQSQILKNINASIIKLQCSHASMNEQIETIQNQHQEFIQQKSNSLLELPFKNSSGYEGAVTTCSEVQKIGAIDEQSGKLEEAYKHKLKAATSLDVSDKDVALVLHYVNDYENFTTSDSSHESHVLKPWKVIGALSNQIIDNALRDVIEELDFDSFFSSMYKLEFQ